MNHLPAGVAHFRKRVTSYVQDLPGGQIQLHFNDNSIAVCDVLVGCDGIKSTIRAQLLREMAENGQPGLLDFIDPIFSGTIAYRGLIPVKKVPKDEQGRSHRTIEFPMMVCLVSEHSTLSLNIRVSLEVLWKKQGELRRSFVNVLIITMSYGVACC